MSGHSKWSQIKHKKAITDAKKGKLFSKLARQISVAAKKGGNPDDNPALRGLVDKARALNMPLENVERAIKKGAGEIAGGGLEEFILEAYGPGGAALIIEGTTDNKNRSMSEIKHLLSQHDGKPATPGSVLWLFDRVGFIEIKKPDTVNQESLEMSAIDSGAQDISWLDQDTLQLQTRPEDLESAKKILEKKHFKIENGFLGWLAKNEVSLSTAKDQERLEKLFEALDDHDDVNEIYTNTK